MALKVNREEVEDLLERLEVVMRSHGETNWIRGVQGARQALREPGDEGLLAARTRYKGMLGGNGTFSDYNVWHPDFETRRNANAEVDLLRDRLWLAFDL
jgi:hypothetical protein